MEDRDRQEILDDIGYLIEVNDLPKLRAITLGSHPADLADLLVHFERKQRQVLFDLLDAEIASEVILELDDATRDGLIDKLPEHRLSELVEEMDSDDAADFVGELPEEVAEKVLEKIEPEDSAEVKQLLAHEEDTAGGIMALELIAVQDNWTVDQAIQEIRRKAEEVEEIYNVYVTDDTGKLIGTLSLQKLILAGPQMRVNEIMDRDVISVEVGTDQEEVANIVRRYDLVAVPVVDTSGKLCGRITIDDVVDVMQEEAAEDISHMAGISSESDPRESSILRISRVRLPWLIIGLLGGMLAAWVLDSFEHILHSEIVMLLFFVPVIMGMGGNAGIQSSTIVVRGLATGDINLRETWARLVRELWVALLNGFLCAALIALIIISLWQEPRVGLLVAFSLLSVMFVAAIVGASVPLILKRLGVDPAIATGPFITISNDILGLFIYMGLASVYFEYVQ